MMPDNFTCQGGVLALNGLMVDKVFFRRKDFCDIL
jgi:hypothetical protein